MSFQISLKLPSCCCADTIAQPCHSLHANSKDLQQERTSPKEQTILDTERMPATEGPSLAMAEVRCQQGWRSSLAPGLRHALASLFVELAKSKGWSPNDPDGLLVTLGLAWNEKQQARRTDLPLCWGLKWAAGSSLACSCTPDDSLKCCLPTAPWSWLRNDLSQKHGSCPLIIWSWLSDCLTWGGGRSSK